MEKVIIKDLVQTPLERTAEETLRDAEALYKNGLYHLSYTQAVYSIEILLKAVLDKYGMFDKKTDKTHNFRRLMNKIEANKCLPDYTIERIEKIFSNVNHIDLTSSSGNYVDCASEEIPNLRYPREDSTPSEMVGNCDALKKIDQAKEMFRIVLPLDGGFVCER